MVIEMNLSKRDQKLIIILLGIVIFAAAYAGVYLNFTNKTTALEAETAALAPRLSELQGYYNSLGTYEKGIEESRAVITENLMQYPEDVRPEDEIMYAVSLEKDVGLFIGSAAFGEPEQVMALRGITETEDGSYSVLPLSAFRRRMDCACSLNYAQLKRTVKYINETPLCTRLNTVSVSYDAETGGLTGTMTIDKYFITGINDAYVETYVPQMPLGTDNIFGTIER